MARLWTDLDDERQAELASQQAGKIDPLSSSELLQSKDLLFRDVFRGSLAYFLTALRFRLGLAALPSRSLADEINEECDRREFAAWIAVPIPDPPESAGVSAASDH